MLSVVDHTQLRRSGTGLAELLENSLTKRWKKYCKELRRCQLDYSEESVHDLRVATRRLISTLNMLAVLMQDNYLPETKRILKKLFDAFSPLRDAQVQILYLQEIVPSCPELQPLFTVLKLREGRLMKQIGRKVRKIKTDAMGKKIGALRESLHSMLANPALESAAHAAIVGTVAGSFARAVDLRGKIDPTKPETIHRLRVAFKKFRYSIEALDPLFPGVGKLQLKAMNTYQVRMGNIQDVEVLSTTVGRFIGRRKSPSPNLRRVIQELFVRKERSIGEFLEAADELFEFWKPGSQQVVLRQVHHSS